MSRENNLRMDWHEIGRNEWQAGGRARSYTILKDEHTGRFSVEVCHGDNPPHELGEFASLNAAMARALKEHHGAPSLDPLLVRLRALHPEREVAL